MKFESFKSLISEAFQGAIQGEDLNTTPPTLTINRRQISAVCGFLRDHEQTYFDMLSCLTGIDNGPEANTMEVIYHLYSIPFEHSLALKVMLERADPHLNSVSNIWKTANWHEREAFDLLGIRFKGHPDLRRILLPEDWEGHPLRKDYQEQEKYHGVTVKY
jgi:NADH-quinone oxidoreductase subunit C